MRFGEDEKKTFHDDTAALLLYAERYRVIEKDGT